MSYQVVIPKPVQKQIDTLPQNVRDRVLRILMKLKDNPQPHGCIKLKGYEDEYRLRVGDYRIRYEIHEKKDIFVVLEEDDHHVPKEQFETLFVVV
jgi:mRNA interferase RelE/StbE